LEGHASARAYAQLLEVLEQLGRLADALAV